MGNDGLELEVGEISLAQTEQSEQAALEAQQQIEVNERKIQQSETRIARYADMLSSFRRFNPTDFNTPQTRKSFTEQLVRANPELEGMSPDIDFSETGQEFLTTLINFVETTKQETERNTEILKAENMKLARDAGVLASKIDTQKRLAREKIRDKKERVRSSQALIEGTATSRAALVLKPVFERISDASPVHLSNGDIITSFDLATMTFEGSFTPSLSSSGAKDFRTQETYVRLMNLVL